MYLVLLALLALQVSDTIMEKFFFLEQSLEDAKKETEKRNGGALKSIQQKAGERNTASAKAQAATASQVRTETQAILKYINDLKEEIIAATEGRDEEHGGLYKGAKNPITEMMLGPGESKSGKGYALKAKLDAYVKSLPFNSKMDTLIRQNLF
jgi:gliding motility-associated protein GldM